MPTSLQGNLAIRNELNLIHMSGFSLYKKTFFDKEKIIEKASCVSINSKH